ncbi:MAG: efflux RND transporter periplasmic adaptor subunit [Sandaracinaceae bacterium]
MTSTSALARRLPLAAALATSVGLGAGCDRLMGEPDAGPELPRLVVTERVSVGDAIDEVRVLGDVHGEREVRVFAQAAERVAELRVEEGDAVEEGDVLMTLSAGIQSAGVQQASAAVDVAAAARDQLSQQIERIRGPVERGAVPRSQLETLEAQLRTSEAQLAQTQAARRTASVQRDLTVVRAPIAGTVAMLSVEAGDMVAPSVPVCTIVEAGRLRVRLRLTEPDYVRVREGMSVALSSPALADFAADGTITRVSPVLDRLTRTAAVDVGLDNPEGRLRPGMVAEARIVLERHDGVVLAPSRALVLSSRTDTERLAHVFVLDRATGTASRREVQLGRRYDAAVAIESGLEGGEEVVVQGQHLLRDGALVRTADGPPEPS